MLHRLLGALGPDSMQIAAHLLLTNSAKLTDLSGTQQNSEFLEIPVFPLLRLRRASSQDLTTQALPRNGIQEVRGSTPLGSTI